MFLILCGKSSSGKDTILKELCKGMGYEPIISVTSRPIREGETNGVEYEFVSKELFESFIKANKLIEYRSYKTMVGGVEDTWYYGVLKGRPAQNRDYAVILDLKGAQDFMAYYGKDQCFCVYIDAPDQIRTIRAMQRGSFDETEWNRRMEADAKDFSEDLVKTVTDVTVENTGKIMEAVMDVDSRFKYYFY
jgi:guanylate kinase